MADTSRARRWIRSQSLRCWVWCHGQPTTVGRPVYTDMRPFQRYWSPCASRITGDPATLSCNHVMALASQRISMGSSRS